MNNFNPSIYNESLENAKVDNYNFKVIELVNVLPQTVIDEIYQSMEDIQEGKAVVQKFVGHKAWGASPSKEQSDFLNSVMSNTVGSQMSLREYSILRYSNEFGYKPKLFPHFDSHAHGGQRLTLDVQLNSTVDWDVFVEGERFSLKNNSAIIFAGTQQVHWRDDLELKDGDYVDILLCHFEYVPEKPLSENQNEILEYRSHWAREELDITNKEIKL